MSTADRLKALRASADALAVDLAQLDLMAKRAVAADPSNADVAEAFAEDVELRLAGLREALRLHAGALATLARGGGAVG